MRKLSIALTLITSVTLFQFCSSSKKTTAASASVTTYEGNIKPIITASCAPCHIEGKGNKKALDNFANASAEADEMIERIQKNPGDHGFMPMRNAKLADSSIALFVDWKKSGLKEK
jgi:cytochrome c553